MIGAVLFVVGCTAAPEESVDAWTPEGGQRIELETRDGITLVADYVQASEPGRPGIALLHMNPVSWDRTSWPHDFLDRLVALDWNVLVLDRRGAGESDGIARDAFEGDAGRYDVESAVVHLVDAGAGPIGLIGASNGTTSLLDYTVWAADEGLTNPVALGLMSGGDYTENQTSMSDLAELGGAAVFTYSTAERDWPLAQQAIAPPDWTFLEYGPNGHGTQLLERAPEVADDLLEWFGARVDQR